MNSHWAILSLGVVILASAGWTLPTTLLEDTKAAATRLDNKVKRSHSQENLQQNAESGEGAPAAFFNGPSASKRGMRDENVEEPVVEWDQERGLKPEVPNKEYYEDENPFEDKSIREYEKGFHYAANRAKLDEQMENAILKSEMYGEPTSINQYRYFGNSGDSRRKRSNMKRSFSRFSNRYKREIELSPEEIMTLLSLLEKDKHPQPFGYRKYWSNDDLTSDGTKEPNEIDEQEENWFDGPVYSADRNSLFSPQFSRDIPNRYNYEDNFDKPQRMYANRQWNDYGDKKRKRFMVSKRFDPTRELRYLNNPSPSRDDLYSLSQLLGGTQREPNIPVAHRMVL